MTQVTVDALPCPQPTGTVAGTISQIVVDATPSASAPSPIPAGAIDERTTETDNFPTESTTTTTDAILTEGAGQELLYSTSQSDEMGDTLVTNFGSQSNPQIIDEFPESSGASWSNTAAAVMTQTLADGTSASRTVAADGSYSETDQLANGARSTIAAGVDGSGSYAIAGVITVDVSAPATGQIAIQTTSGGGGGNTYSAQQWFTPGSSLVTDNFVDNGSKTFDPSCSVPGSIGTSGTQVVETMNLTDPVLGYTEARTTTSYDVPGFGPACVVIVDTLKSYYDYQDTTPNLDVYVSPGGVPLQTSTLSETLSMQTPTSPYARRRAAEERMAFVRSLQRAQMVRNLDTFAIRLAKEGSR